MHRVGLPVTHFSAVMLTSLTRIPPGTSLLSPMRVIAESFRDPTLSSFEEFRAQISERAEVIAESLAGLDIVPLKQMGPIRYGIGQAFIQQVHPVG
jgi:hypothetical protein